MQTSGEQKINNEAGVTRLERPSHSRKPTSNEINLKQGCRSFCQKVCLYLTKKIDLITKVVARETFNGQRVRKSDRQT